LFQIFGKYHFGKDKISNEDKHLLVRVKDYVNSFTLERAKDFFARKAKKAMIVKKGESK
jgi:hypothetical protein